MKYKHSSLSLFFMYFYSASALLALQTAVLASRGYLSVCPSLCPSHSSVLPG